VNNDGERGTKKQEKEAKGGFILFRHIDL